MNSDDENHLGSLVQGKSRDAESKGRVCDSSSIQYPCYSNDLVWCR